MRYCLLLLLVFCGGCSNFGNYFDYRNTTIETGYTYGDLKGDDISAVAFTARPSWRVNKLINLHPRYGSLEFGMEGFAYSLLQPDVGAVVGLTPMLKYSYPIYRWMSLYAEAGAGPGYISIDTYEQEVSGFSFLDQIGAGTEIKCNDTFGIRFGYRFGHLSHGGILPTRNRGIETHTATFGIVLWFP